jgi:hypothetical protein
VHWHLGAEHYNQGTYDQKPPPGSLEPQPRATEAGYQCSAWVTNDGGLVTQTNNPSDDSDDASHPSSSPATPLSDSAFSDEQMRPYEFQHCAEVHVGVTVEFHWVMSNHGGCSAAGTGGGAGAGGGKKRQQNLQDGLGGAFCTTGSAGYEADNPLTVGVEGQVFTIVNDVAEGESSGAAAVWRPSGKELLAGPNLDWFEAADRACYTGSSTGPSHNNAGQCSAIRPVSFQVDRGCYALSAWSMDRMCLEMKKWGMIADIRPDGSRVLVNPDMCSDNVVNSGAPLVYPSNP